MKHYPASRYHPRLEGVSVSGKGPATIVIRRSTALLTLAVVAAFFFFAGAYGFGCALLSQHAH